MTQKLNQKKLAWGGMTDTQVGNMGAGMQIGAQLIQTADGMGGRPSMEGQFASGALSGASMGSSFGPWGAAAGAVIGGGAALLNAEAAKRKEAQMQEQHRKQQLEIDTMNSKQTLRNYATKGVSLAGAYPYGGEIQPQSQFEVEGDEVVQGATQLEAAQPIASDMQTAVGADHAEGGIQGQGAGRVFSDRLKASNGKTFAVNADKLGKQKGKFEAKLDSTNGATKFTGERMVQRIDADIDNLFNEQEMKKLATQPPSLSSSFAYGGITDPGPRALDKTLVPTLIKNGGFGNTTVSYNGQLFEGLGNNVDQKKNYVQPYVNDTWTDYQNGKVPVVNDGKYPTPYIRGNNGTGAALAVRDFQPAAAINNNNIQLGPNTGKLAPANLAIRPLPVTGTAGPGINTGARKGMDFAGAALPFLDNFGNALATAATPQIPRPYIDPEVQLNTKFDVNPQLQEAREARIGINKSIDVNTANSAVGNANKQKLYASAMGNSNQLYAQKFNIENQLQNQETMINSRINMGNRERFGEYDQKVAARRAGMASDYANNLANVQTDLYTAARDNKMDARDVEVAKMITMANPNLPTYGSNLDMVKKQFQADPAHAKRVLGGILKESPNNAAAIALAKELGITL